MNFAIGKRTFAAAKYEKKSPQRELLNDTPEHSEYYISEKWFLRWPFIMSDGTTHPNQPYLYRTFRTRKEAQEYANTSLSK